MGKKSVAQALKAALEPFDLHENIAYHSVQSNMAYVAKRSVTDLSMARLFAWMEEYQQRERKREAMEKDPKPYVSWTELSTQQPWCTDPMLVNRDSARSGDSCMAGRGLRASARSLCRFHSADILTQQMFKQSCSPAGKLKVASLEEWRQLGCCLDIGLGWQQLRFRRLKDGTEVVGWGHLDGSSGSVALRVEDLTVTVLLNCID